MNRNSRQFTGGCRGVVRGWTSPSLERQGGFGTTELLIAFSLVAILAGLAAPAYQDAIEKRRITNGAEQIAAFVNLAQSESIKRNRKVTVSYATEQDGAWCIGATLGQVACDCMATDPMGIDYCSIDASPWLLRNGDVQARDLIQSVTGDGAYVFDPVRGMFADAADGLVFSLHSGAGKFQMNLSVVSTGMVSLCVQQVSAIISGFKSCPPEP